MGWIQDLINPKTRRWEEFYRNRWQHDNIFRSTHGVNCTGGCSWAIYVKDGIITWEMQQTDYPLLGRGEGGHGIPPYEPRGCQRGISASWYVYSPIRVKYPYGKGVLLDFWREARSRHSNPIEAWGSIVSDENKRTRWQKARGKGGFRRTTWDELVELICSACLYTAQRYGPDRVYGFAPIPAMSMLSYAAGQRFLQLFGAFNLSFYDWYADLPTSFPEVWGDQTDVCEGADWYNSKFIVSMASNLNMTRTPDVHFISEARHEGAKFVVLAPDFSQVSKYADWWIPVKRGQDLALWMAVGHVIYTEFHVKRQVPYFVDYIKRYTDMPYLVKLEKEGDSYRSGRFLTSEETKKYKKQENAAWKQLVIDAKSGEMRCPTGSVGHRWQKKHGEWNLKMEDSLDFSPIDPVLTFLGASDDVVQVQFPEFDTDTILKRGVPAKKIDTGNGTVLVATVYDLNMAQYAIDRGLPGDYPKDYDDPKPYTPAWQEQWSGIGRQTVIRFAREFAGTAEKTKGRAMVIVGASANHWFHNNHYYRAAINCLIACGCCGRNGGGMNHYVGQEKLAMVAPWNTLASALDWGIKPRLQQSPVWHYTNSCSWRYDNPFWEYAPVPATAKWSKGAHSIDLFCKSVRMGWMPHYPQFNRSPLEVVREAQAAGAKDDKGIVDYTVKALKNKKLAFSIDDPDAPENWGRVWFIWRGNALQSSAKGAEFFLRHYLGTHDNAVAPERAKEWVKEVKWREPAPRGKLDLVIDLNFRMDTSALYSDIVLPAAFWYEKNDLNTTDLHSFVHPLGQAVPPVWESKSDWEIFKLFAKKTSEMAPMVFPEPVKDIVMAPLTHDTPDELAQREVLDWRLGECEPIPGKTMPHFRIVERDYSLIYNKFISLGEVVRETGVTGNGCNFSVAKQYDDMRNQPLGASPDPRHKRAIEWGGKRYPCLEDAIDAANMVLYMAPETNGEVCYQAFQAEEHHTGVPLTDLAEKSRAHEVNFYDITRQPRRQLVSPVWTGNITEGRAYSAWCLNVERLIPWRTLTGRQQIYIDHPWYLDFGHHLCTYRRKLEYKNTKDLEVSPIDEQTLILNYITPHGKWNIHSTYKDNHRMLTLSRGMDPVWINDKDAESVGLKDNDWVEVYNDNGVIVTRANVSRRVQRGMCLYYHAVERTIYIPKSQIRGGRRAGGHNSVTRTRLNPVFLAGGGAQFTYSFNYWGPTGVLTRDTHVAVRKLEKLEW
ncbi:MAG: nitrate reductase subunit alpha [Nitrococcus sp.]|nr:nitrate reductase subunit alpha [Nitrococcus sp.]